MYSLSRSVLFYIAKKTVNGNADHARKGNGERNPFSAADFVEFFVELFQSLVRFIFAHDRKEYALIRIG